MIRPGRRIAGLRVEDWVGRGGASEVYRLRDAGSGRAYALKVVVRGDPRAADREFEALQALDHPGFVRPIGVLDVVGRRGLLMEWIDGPSLGRWVREVRPSLARSAALLDDACDALAHAHERGLFHRDLKPANLLLQRGDDGWRVRVADLGLATIGDGPVEVGGGTAGYTAPERLHGAPGDARSDVFSLGCVAFLLATGAPPFVGPDRLSVWNAVAHGQRRVVAAAAPGLQPAWVEVIEACLAGDPARRPVDAGALRDLVSRCPPTSRVRPRAGWDRHDWDDDAHRARRRAWLDQEDAIEPAWHGDQPSLSDAATPKGTHREGRRPVAPRVDPHAATVPRAPRRTRGRRRAPWIALALSLGVLTALVVAWWLT